MFSVYFAGMKKERQMFIGSATLVLLIILQGSCVSHDFPTYTCPDEPVSYDEQVHPIVTTKCAIQDCHGSDPDLPNWADFDTFQEGARNGNVKNYVVNRIMPPDFSHAGPLSQEQINIIACWVDQGAEKN